VRAASADNAVLPLNDPLADRLRAAVATSSSTGALVDALLSVREMFGTDLPERRDWRDLLVRQVDLAAVGGDPSAG
jgi:fructuronate reductase